MQFPVMLVTPPPSGEDFYEIKDMPPVTAARSIRTDLASYPEQGLPQGKNRPEQEAESGEESNRRYTGRERRIQCRRITQESILLDTRSGRDRRRPEYYDDGTSTNVDEVA